MHVHYNQFQTKIYNKNKRNWLKLQLGEQKGILEPRSEQGQVRKERGKDLEREEGLKGKEE